MALQMLWTLCEIFNLNLMRTVINLLFLSTIFFTACEVKQKDGTGNCLIIFDSLFKGLDTSKFEIRRFPRNKEIEFLEEPGSTQERGLFSFDSNRILRSYCFLNDSLNSSCFCIQFDSSGQKKRFQCQGGDILAWSFRKPRPDSVIRFSFLLSELDCHYEKISVEAGNFKELDIKPFMTKFLKVIGVSGEIPSTLIGKSRLITVYGIRKDNCSMKHIVFKDTTTSMY
jgi:hypothetical protein